MSKATIKNLLFCLIMAILIFPLFFQLFEGTITYKLKGYKAPPKKVTLDVNTWLDGSWQKYAEAYSQDKLQARHFLIRLNNQLKFSLFDKLNANGVERGRNDFYFERRYINAYLGTNFQGDAHYVEKVEKLQELTDTLKAHGIEMLFVIAAGKASFMPENIPEKYLPIKKGKNNYEAFTEQLKKSSIPFLDLNQYLSDMKDTATYPLYTKGNIHWSFYAISFVTDTLVQVIENQLDKGLPAYVTSPVEVAYEPTFYTEGGIFKSLNLYWTEIKDTFAYRNFVVDEASLKDKYRPKVWVVGDSYYGTLRTYEIPQHFFDESATFFYYNQSVVNQKDKNYKPGTIKDNIEKIEEQDLLIFFTTDAGIPGCSWGAEEEILKYYKEKSN
jgi:hypothetical protein